MLGIRLGQIAWNIILSISVLSLLPFIFTEKKKLGLGFCFLMTTILLLIPLSWTHTHTLLLLPMSLLLAEALTSPRKRRTLLIGLYLAWALILAPASVALLVFLDVSTTCLESNTGPVGGLAYLVTSSRGIMETKLGKSYTGVILCIQHVK